MQTVLDIDHLGFAWGKRTVLDGVSLAVRPGEFVALLGPNGSGKSTLLSIVAGLTPPYQGRVAWNFGGAHVGLRPGHAEALGRIGVVFQSPGLDQTLSARENLQLAARMAGMGRAAARQKTEALLSFAELDQRADERVRQLSGGMRRRVDLARALLHDPEVLLLDEPTVGLDHASFERFWQRIAEVRRQRRLTVICATHRPDEAEKSDRLVMISGGRIVHEGSPEATTRALGSDLVVAECADPVALAAQAAAALGVPTRVTGPDSFVCEVPDASTGPGLTGPGLTGPGLIVRLVEALPRGSLTSVALRRPNLGDAFVKIAGGSLDANTARAA